MSDTTSTGGGPELRDCWVWWDRLNPGIPRCSFDPTDAQPGAVRYRAACWGDAIAVFVQRTRGITPPKPTNRYPVIADADDPQRRTEVPGRERLAAAG